MCLSCSLPFIPALHCIHLLKKQGYSDQGHRNIKELMRDSNVRKILVLGNVDKLSNQCMQKAIVSGTESMTHRDSRRP